LKFVRTAWWAFGLTGGVLLGKEAILSFTVAFSIAQLIQIVFAISAFVLLIFVVGYGLEKGLRAIVSIVKDEWNK
jgi:hypothetical protein